jgi:hypothetical protein
LFLSLEFFAASAIHAQSSLLQVTSAGWRTFVHKLKKAAPPLGFQGWARQKFLAQDFDCDVGKGGVVRGTSTRKR